MQDRLSRAPRAPLAPHRPVGGKRPFISVIVPVRNEGRFIADTLAQLLAQDYPANAFEVLVADGRSTDDTRAIVRAWMHDHPNVRLLDNPALWSSAGRNVALRASKGDILLLVDGHCELRSHRYLSDLAHAFARSGADCIGRPQPLDVTGASPLQRAIAAARSCPFGHHPASHIYSAREGFVPPQSVAVAYRREVFAEVGPFDETFDACEDVELNTRLHEAGLTCFFTPRAAVHYHPRASLAGLFRQMVRYGRGRVRLLRKHPSSFSAGGFVPAAFLAGVVLGPLAVLLVPALGWLYGSVLLLYAILVVVFSAGTACKQRDIALLPLLPLVFVTVHVGAGAGQWLEALAGRQLVRRRQQELASLAAEL